MAVDAMNQGSQKRNASIQMRPNIDIIVHSDVQHVVALSRDLVISRLCINRFASRCMM